MTAAKRIGRYQLERVLGSGSFATVWLAYDEGLDGHIAIKILAENWSLDEDIKRRFLEEARILWRAQHDRIVRVHLVDQLEDGRPYFVMDYADGGTLDDRLRARFGKGETFSVVEAVAFGREIAECLAVAHHLGIVHRDLKPSNILYRSTSLGRAGQDSVAYHVVLADFGLAKRLEAATQFTVVAGTPAYMAPEQADRALAASVDERADIFSASAILYEVLTGRPPFDGESIDSIRKAHEANAVQPLEVLRPGVPHALELVVLKSLDPNPDNRHRSALEWSDALAAAVMRGDAVRPVRETLLEDPRSAAARVANTCDRLIARFKDNPIVGAISQARERVVEPARLVIAGAPEAVAQHLAATLDGTDELTVDVVAPVRDEGKGSSELPAPAADVCVVLLPPEPDAARDVALSLRRSLVDVAEGPIVAVGVFCDVAIDGSALTADLVAETLRSIFLSTCVLRDDSSTEGQTSSKEILNSAYASEAGEPPAVSVDGLCALLGHLIRGRADLLRADAALGLLRRALITHSGQSWPLEELADEVERLELELPELAELRALREQLAGRVTLPASYIGEFRRVLLEYENDARLGVEGGASGDARREAAFRGAERWRALSDRTPFAARDAVLTVSRRYDALWNQA